MTDHRWKRLVLFSGNCQNRGNFRSQWNDTSRVELKLEGLERCLLLKMVSKLTFKVDVTRTRKSSSALRHRFSDLVINITCKIPPQRAEAEEPARTTLVSGLRSSHAGPPMFSGMGTPSRGVSIRENFPPRLARPRFHFSPPFPPIARTVFTT